MSTSKPATREEFKQFCLRRLGAPLLEINIDDDQTEDCIEIAFQYYYDYHYDATEKVFLAHVPVASLVARNNTRFFLGR